MGVVPPKTDTDFRFFPAFAGFSRFIDAAPDQQREDAAEQGDLPGIFRCTFFHDGRYIPEDAGIQALFPGKYTGATNKKRWAQFVPRSHISAKIHVFY